MDAIFCRTQWGRIPANLHACKPFPRSATVCCRARRADRNLRQILNAGNSERLHTCPTLSATVPEGKLGHNILCVGQLTSLESKANNQKQFLHCNHTSENPATRGQNLSHPQRQAHP